MLLIFNSCLLFLGMLILKILQNRSSKDSFQILSWCILSLLSIICSSLYLSDFTQIKWNEILTTDRLFYVLMILVFSILIELFSPSFKHHKSKELEETSQDTLNYREYRYDKILRKVVEVMIVFVFIISILNLVFKNVVNDEQMSTFQDAFNCAFGLILVFISSISLHQMFYHFSKIKKVTLSDELHHRHEISQLLKR